MRLINSSHDKEISPLTMPNFSVNSSHAWLRVIATHRPTKGISTYCGHSVSTAHKFAVRLGVYLRAKLPVKANTVNSKTRAKLLPVWQHRINPT